MSATKSTLPFIFLFISFISCNSNKEKNAEPLTSLPVTVLDTVSITAPESLNLSAYSEAWQQAATQTFIAAPGKISVIKAQQGLRITVDPAVLEKEDGTMVDGNIIVKVVELTSSDALFKNNAATISNGRLLVSGGSYFVDMECRGEKLRIKKGQQLRMEFPTLKNNEMELFYGDRDADGNMNWQRANEPLSFNQFANYTVYNPPYPGNTGVKHFKSRYRMYASLKSAVYFEDKLISIENLVKLLRTRGVDKNIDTVRIPAYEFYTDMAYHASFKYDTIIRYRILSCEQLEAERDSMAKAAILFQQQHAANLAYNAEWQKVNANNSLEAQLQNYYAPSAVTKLGWINCDRFYNNLQNTEMPVEIPYTFNNPDIQYFLIYKSFNGLMSGRIRKNAKQQYVLSNLPQGEAVTFIAFTKSNGQVYHCKEDFVVSANTLCKPDFKPISEPEMRNIFGSNVKM
jgi:hypothetical protein